MFNRGPLKDFLTVKRILVLIVLIGVVLVALIAHEVFAQTPIISSIASPDKTYLLHLKGHETRPFLPIIEHSVYFDVFRNKELDLRNRSLHSGDWFDPSFKDLYPQYNWVSNSVIRFGREAIDEDKYDSLIVSNDSNQPINYLRIQSADLFLLFDLAPKSNVRLSAYPQTWLSWITVEGEFRSGELIQRNGSNFSLNGSGPFQYEISISESGSRINGSRLNEYLPDNPK